MTGTAAVVAPDETRRAGTVEARSKPWFWWSVGSISLVGLVLRVLWSVYAARPPQGLYDPARYTRAAELIAAGHGYVEPFTGKPTAYYPPGYPWFFGIVTWIAKHNPLIHDQIHLMAYAQSVLGAATVIAAAVIGRRLHSAATGVVAALFVALYPNLIFHSAAMLSETLAIALLCSSLAVLWARPVGVPLARWQLWTFAVLFALGVMVRPISLPVVAVIFVLWWFEFRRRVVVRQVAVTLAVLVVVMGAWTVRNAVRMHGFVPLSTNTGDNLCIGHGPGATGPFQLTPRCATKVSILNGPAGEIAHDSELRARAWKGIKKDWRREPWLTWRRLYYMFRHDNDGLFGVTSYRTDHWMPDKTFALLTRIGDDYGAVVLGLGIAGSVFLLRRREGRGFVAMTAIVLSVPLLFFGDARFKVPAMPLLAIAGGYAVVSTGALGARLLARMRSTGS